MPHHTDDEVPAVRYSTTSDGLPFAYRSGEVITTNLKRALEVLGDLYRREGGAGEGPGLEYQVLDAEEDEEIDDVGDEGTSDPSGALRDKPRWRDPTQEPPDGRDGGAPPIGPFFLVRGIADPLHAVAELRAHSILAQPNYVYFSHTQLPYSLVANPAYANPAYANPAYANPAYANPAYANPAYANPASATDAVIQTSSAVPAARGKTTGAIEELLRLLPQGPARVFVLDTGLPAPGAAAPGFAALLRAPSSIRPLRLSDAADRPDNPGRPYLAFAAGHGTFIATLIPQVAPGCRIGVGRVLSNTGVGDEWTIARRIHALTVRLRHLGEPEFSVLSLSFGAPVLDHPYLMAHVISAIQSIGVVVVASAGNEATSRPMFPAALPGVIGVGALGPLGPAEFTNYGAWVTACAPGVDLVSGFLRWNGGRGLDFDDWAIWSGTSFSAPIVAATLARYIMTAPGLLGRPVSGREARQQLVDAPWLMRVPGLGTVINVV
jgi:Subtilase family